MVSNGHKLTLINFSSRSNQSNNPRSLPLFSPNRDTLLLYSATHISKQILYPFRESSVSDCAIAVMPGEAFEAQYVTKCSPRFLSESCLLTKTGVIKYFRTCIGLHDAFHNRLIMHNNLLEPILDIVIETMPKDNLLNSACLELFEFIRRVSLTFPVSIRATG